MSYTRKKEMIAMLLAGGQGSRLGVLTDHVAKPAVLYGGKYRIIDFPLSNCVNSGIDTVGVLTQYQPLELNAYIGSGQPWNLDRLHGGVFILPPYTTGKDGVWYKGTANAIYQNMEFVELYEPEYLLVLSGDHVYKMNYEKMLDTHKASGADCTVAALRVPFEEACRFGIMNTDSDMRICEFEEKPASPKSDLASMGVYIFNWKVLREFLVADEADPRSSNDFGKNVLPAMLAAGCRMFAYEFKGYWKDVGTIESLWEANMDILDPGVPLELDDPPWRIYSRNMAQPPQYIGENASLKNCSITEGCIVDGEVKDSILFPSVMVGKGAKIRNSIIMSGCVIEEGSVVEYAILAPESKVGTGARVGETSHRNDESSPITVLGQGVFVPPGSMVLAGSVLSSREEG